MVVCLAKEFWHWNAEFSSVERAQPDRARVTPKAFGLQPGRFVPNENARMSASLTFELPRARRAPFRERTRPERENDENEQAVDGGKLE